MTDLTARSRANKRKGAQFEVGLENFFNQALIKATRLVKRGKDDEGDLMLRIGPTVIIVEAKNEKSINLSGYLDEATTEALNYESRHVHDPDAPETVIGVAAVKRRNKGIHKTYVVMEADDFASILRLLKG
jgi:hypothetical protein